MKDFFSHFGWVSIAAAMIITALMFTNPMAGEVGKQELNMSDLLADKTMEFAGLKDGSDGGAGGGSNPVVDGTNITLSNDADGNGVVSKGDTLTFDKTYLYGNAASTSPDQFLVLNTNGYDVELLATSNYQNSKFNISFTTATDSTGKPVQKYEGSTLDTLLNTTYYNSLSSTVQSKIKPKDIIQNTWRFNGTPAEATVSALDGTPYTYKKTGTVGTYNRNVYALDVQDVIDYLGTSFTGEGVNEMFFNTESAQPGKYVWLRSADYGTDSGSSYCYAFYVGGDNGYLNYTSHIISNEARPAFTITLN